MRFLPLPYCAIAYLGLSSAQGDSSNGGLHTVELSARQANVVQRRFQRRDNLPLANYFLGTDLQVSYTFSTTLFYKKFV